MSKIDLIQTSRNMAREDKKVLKRKRIKAPSNNEMPYSIEVKKERAKYQFSTPEKYLLKFKKLTGSMLSENLKLSHPELCMKTTSESPPTPTP
ncbi:hypothetical protein [Sunxiuqinia indica]|uniref:hypothetical protein n=1 Tax=Sunxiuqinia indica TaxID=2692584 RepID=UPI00135A5272|nr:hypothetical protein [Sunxiuqinia indica]